MHSRATHNIPLRYMFPLVFMLQLFFALVYHIFELLGIMLKDVIAVIVVGVTITLLHKALYSFCRYLMIRLNLRLDDVGELLCDEKVAVVEHKHLITHAQGKCVAGDSATHAAHYV